MTMKMTGKFAAVVLAGFVAAACSARAETVQVHPAPTDPAPAVVSIIVAPAPPAQDDPPAITQATPYRSGDIHVSGFKATRKDGSVNFMFAVRNMSDANILIAIDNSVYITAACDSGSATSDSMVGMNRASMNSTDVRDFTELSPGSVVYVGSRLSARAIADSSANFNINLVQLRNGKTQRYSFGRPVAIVER